MKLHPWLAGLVFGALALSTGCGGGGGSSSGGATGNVSVLLKDAPLLAVPGSGRSFSELNVDILGLDASPIGTRTYNAIPLTLINGAARVNLLDLTSDQDWLAFAQLPVGRYDHFRLTIDPATASMIDNANGSTQALTMHPNNTNGTLDIRLAPPLVVTTSTAQHLVLIDWDARQSVSYAANPTPTGTYFLAGHFVAHPVNQQSAPLPFRALPGRLTSVDTTTGEMRVQIERHNNGRYLVRTSATTTLEDVTGTALTISDFAAGDFVVISGTVDANADIDATRVKKLPGPGALPPAGPGGHNNGGPGSGPGGGGNTGPGGGPSGGGAPNGVVFAVGAINQQTLDTTLNTFVLRTGRGPIAVTYSDSTTMILDATVRPPQPTNDNSFTPTIANGTVIVEVAGLYVAPASATALPTINAATGRIVVIRRQ